MAGSLAVIPSNDVDNSATTIRDQWEICFARFVPYPTSSPSSSAGLLPLPPRLRNRSPRGNWISSPSVAFLRLLPDLSHRDVILTVSFNASLLEEHYVSKLHFSWPQVSCVSGFPARGIRTVLVSFRDSVGEIQKFALRFPSLYEAQSFVNILKGLLKDEKDPEPLNTDFGSEISSQSEFVSSNKHCHRPSEEASFMTPVDTYKPQMPRSIKTEEKQPSGTQEMEAPPGFSIAGILPALPPSFTTLLMDCSEINHTQPIASQEIELKSQIVRYMEDSSFQDMLVKVEKVIDELGGDLSLP
ncbi:protein POOR HOMOLOGOUS SYNAPSIS 1 [Arachis stenosperma]|uniref:protein POOR HOMOLOGOUS SYNAPSIS 1 n=1 Tax=Arachis stenosperma TaxID=217475 RepID=UPI0025ACBA03|nr:protein POOR HOMOLOGOUS SYNAPSIS 1 [Arachis stenosperma]